MAEKKPPVFEESKLGVASQLELSAEIAVWREAKTALANATAKEMETRLTIVNKWFPNFVEGTNTGKLRAAELKCGMGLNRNVSQDKYKEAWAWATLEDTPPRLKLRELLLKVFKPTYDISIGAWKALDDKERLKLADIVTEKPGTPSLAYKETT